MKLAIKGFFCKCDKILGFLPKKFLMEFGQHNYAYVDSGILPKFMNSFCLEEDK